jgi:transposase-like protein
VKRSFTPEFKAQLVKEALETGNCSIVARKHDIHPSVLARWVRKHKGSPVSELSKKAIGSKNTDLLKSAKQSKELEEQNFKLKKLIGEKELEIEILRDLLKKTNAPLPPR